MTLENLKRIEEHFDIAYKSVLEKYKRETRDQTPIEIYNTSLIVVGERIEFEKDNDLLKTPQEIEEKIPVHIKKVMLMDCLVTGKGALYPYLPDPSVIMKYAEEAAYIVMQLTVKLRMRGKPPKGKRHNRFADAIEKFGDNDDKKTINKIIDYLMELESTVKVKGESHDEARDKKRSAIQKDFSRYRKDHKGIK